MFDRLSETLTDLVTTTGFSGSILVTDGGTTRFQECHGHANRADEVPITPSTRFGLGSVTKIFTSATVLSLVADDLITTDTRLVDVLPAEARPTGLLPQTTIGHLLSHTSGIADYFEEETATADWPQEFAALWRDRPVYTVLRPADYLPLFAELPPYREPGGRYQYSNAGYVLLGLVIEAVTGIEYADAVHRRVFEPAEMTDSGFFAADAVLPHIATGYLPPLSEGGPWRSNIFAMPSVGGSDGGSVSSPADLDRFLTRLDGGAILPADQTASMFQPHVAVTDDIHMGYGVYLRGNGSSRYWQSEGFDPGYEAILRRFPEFDVNVVVLSNVNDVAGAVCAVVTETVLATYGG
ncbi:serine hydrolase domain-containing protein [Stackebrandtia endophytica]|uniref:serine hydrolase domain-containing protein n=1 Tax=Stackebrandtia endophytica TaxID=1496996 RepID=UPI00147714D5|nr:serine hydrolase domain-containing protein [Stackebrandtia endophytica]